jgi:hypothetical protein
MSTTVILLTHTTQAQVASVLLDRRFKISVPGTQSSFPLPVALRASRVQRATPPTATSSTHLTLPCGVPQT